MDSPMSKQDDWDRIVDLVRAWARRRFRDEPVALHIELRHLGRAKLPLPLPLTAAAEPEAGEPRHSDDFRRVWWPGVGELRLTPKQAIVVKLLWEARDTGDRDIDQRTLLEAADSDCV